MTSKTQIARAAGRARRDARALARARRLATDPDDRERLRAEAHTAASVALILSCPGAFPGTHTWMRSK